MCLANPGVQSVRFSGQGFKQVTKMFRSPTAKSVNDFSSPITRIIVNNQHFPTDFSWQRGNGETLQRSRQALAMVVRAQNDADFHRIKNPSSFCRKCLLISSWL